MKIQVASLGLPSLAALIGKKADLELDGVTVQDLMDQLIAKHGPEIRQILLDTDGEPDPTIQVLVGDGFVPREEMPRFILKEGDTVRFLLLVGGG